MSYSPTIDRKWQQRWEENKLAAFNPERLERKLYVMEMFSYPSGANLHLGHWYNYGLSDSWARMKKMQGWEVFQPMGFDAFGLPAENYAIKTGIHPFDSTMSNIRTMERQLRDMGGIFNWDHELATCDPEYYRWNQWLFLQLYRRGLAYRKKAPVNWCPRCNTVLANEQVLADGSCERCAAIVGKKNLTQWFFRITDYSQELLDDLQLLDWPERTKKSQINWIGRSEGAEISFAAEKDGAAILDSEGNPLRLTVFTTRADTLMGVSYLVVAPELDLTDLLVTEEERQNVLAYQEQARHASEIERLATTRDKSGVFTGAYALHPITNERLPIWTADYVIASYGTGVVMAVPAHDERDFEFAQRYGLPVRRVILDAEGRERELPFCEDGILTNSGTYDKLPSAVARDSIVARLMAEHMGKKSINYRLRDWLVSRQRYWGTPIPIIHCPSCGVVPVPESELPVRLPYDVEFTPDGESPLRKCREFIECRCPDCGGPAERDPDTLDTFVDSSWYQFRYVDNKNSEEAFRRDLVNAYAPVDVYIGGAEHAVMHLLYARFITKALRDMGYLDFDEPFLRLIHQGTILGPDGQRMSKSKGNTISPDSYVERYGSDAFRLYLAFGFAYTEGGPWNDDGLKAIVKFIGRVEKLLEDVRQYPASFSYEEGKKHFSRDEKELNAVLHHSISQVTVDAERFQFNTSVARMMELLNALQKYQTLKQKNLAFLRYASERLLLLLAPFAPHFAEECWEGLGHRRSIFLESWPGFDEAALRRDELEIAVQMNGKIVGRVMAPGDAGQAEMLEIVRGAPEFTDWLAGREIVKAIAVPGRLLNFVVKA